MLSSASLVITIYFPTQCVEHVVAQRIANLRVQKPENAPFSLLKIAFSDPPGPMFLYPQRYKFLLTRASKSVPPSPQFVLSEFVVESPCLFNP